MPNPSYPDLLLVSEADKLRETNAELLTVVRQSLAAMTGHNFRTHSDQQVAQREARKAARIVIKKANS